MRCCGVVISQSRALDHPNVYSHDRIIIVNIEHDLTKNFCFILKVVLIDSVFYRCLVIGTPSLRISMPEEKTCLMVEWVGGAMRDYRPRAEVLT
jgi:hypothetical protein